MILRLRNSLFSAAFRLIHERFFILAAPDSHGARARFLASWIVAQCLNLGALREMSFGVSWMSGETRRGVSLVEVVVMIAIMAVLMGLLVPAVQRAPFPRPHRLDTHHRAAEIPISHRPGISRCGEEDF